MVGGSGERGGVMGYVYRLFGNNHTRPGNEKLEPLKCTPLMPRWSRDFPYMRTSHVATLVSIRSKKDPPGYLHSQEYLHPLEYLPIQISGQKIFQVV